MIIEVYKKSDTTKGLMIQNLTRNADDIIIDISKDYGIAYHNKENYEQNNIVFTHFNEILPIRNEDNAILTIKAIKEQLIELGLEENIDFKVKAESDWNGSDLNLPVRITIPESVIMSNPNYLALVSHVQTLVVENKAKYDIIDELVIMYFLRVEDAHKAMFDADNNVLIEYQ